MIKSHDIIACTETMKGKYFQQHFPCYQCLQFPRLMKHRDAKSNSGGMLILISDMLFEYVRVNRESDSQIEGKCVFKLYDINVGVIYISPEGSPYANIDNFDILGESVRNNSNKLARYIFVEILTHVRVNWLIMWPRVLRQFIWIYTYSTISTPRNNVDKTVNGYRKKLTDLCKYIGLQICNCRLSESIYTLVIDITGKCSRLPNCTTRCLCFDKKFYYF